MAAPEGNHNRANQYRVQQTLLKVLEARSASKADAVEGLMLACTALLDKAESGDVQAFKEIADRLDGKAKQQIEASGPGGGPVKFVIER